MASRSWLVGLVGLGLALDSQASRVYLPRMAIHAATDEASRVYSISVFTFHNESVYTHG